jgi:hypothetical protein
MHGRDEKCMQNFWLENLKGRDHMEEIGIGGQIILEWFSGKLDRKVWTEFVWLRAETRAGPLCIW